MHVYFSGIGGTGISALAVIAKQAGWDVSGSDARHSQYLDYLRKHGITNLHVGIDREHIAAVHAHQPIDWFVYGSAQPLDFPDHPEFAFCDQTGIKKTKRDEFLNQIIQDKKLKLIAVAGTHGKSTVTAMAIWLFKQIGLPISYSVGAKISFGDMGHLDPKSKYFVYEADEFDRNFLTFYPELSLISGIDWDHPDIYPTREAYLEAFEEFIEQSNSTVLWHDDAEQLNLVAGANLLVLDQKNPSIDKQVKLPGHVNRLNAWLVVRALQKIVDRPATELINHLNVFPGLSRRFEQLAPNLYSDYAHTPPKIRGALQLAGEVGGNNIVVIYEGLHNTRQHFIKAELAHLFDNVKQLYIVPSFLAREDKDLELLTPAKLLDLLSNKSQEHAQAAELNGSLRQKILDHLEAKDLVLCLNAGGSGGLDEWLRQEFIK